LHINKEVSKDIARKRIEEALETEAKILATTCPFCKTQFDNIANGKIVVKDITELLLETLNKTFTNESTRIV
ncbi:MAG: heterodisulfide reductase-related iron-sulfur binding cluster, partial [Candidatus Baldrarchaeia archaeon]